MAIATIRQARPEDAPICGQICYDAFLAITAAHNFPPYVPSKDAFLGLFSTIFPHSGYYCVAAEADGRIVGSNCMDERTPIAGIGPITVDPGLQNRGVGRALMRAVMKRAEERNFAGVRLVQAAYHTRSLSLYTTLGFIVREPLALMLGPAIGKASGVRAATAADVKGCNRVCWKVHGHDRGGELADAIQQGIATVVERDGRITGYSTGVKFFGHSVGETNPDLQALIAASPGFEGPGFLVPTRNAELFRWCLANRLRVGTDDADVGGTFTMSRRGVLAVDLVLKKVPHEGKVGIGLRQRRSVQSVGHCYISGTSFPQGSRGPVCSVALSVDSLTATASTARRICSPRKNRNIRFDHRPAEQNKHPKSSDRVTRRGRQECRCNM